MKEGEFVIYHTYQGKAPEPLPKRKEGRDYLASFLSKIALISAAIGITLLLVSYGPSAWYFVTKGASDKLAALIAEPVAGTEKAVGTAQKDVWQPNFNPNLPLEARLIIPSIGVDTAIQEATAANLEAALRKGVWRVSDFGTPADRTYPTIVAAHRYGYLAWSNSFRRKNSFFNLPKLKEGAIVEIIWKQRKYTFEVYGGEEGEEISDYEADLILYTCEGLNSPVRIFKYARLLKI